MKAKPAIEAMPAAVLNDVKRLVDHSFYSLIPLAIAFVIVGILANSLTVMSVAVDYGLSFIVQIFAFQSIRTIRKSNVIQFPYGTGKLENFSGFLYGALAIPASAYIFYFSVVRFFNPPGDISFSITQIPLLPSLARSLYLYVFACRLQKQLDSPLVDSYRVNFKVSAFFDVGVLLAMSTAWILTLGGHTVIASYLDPSVSLFLALYMFYMGVSQTVGNFKVLVDLPLPESEQLKIMGVLAREFEQYEDVGHIYTRRSGRRRFVDIELYLKNGTTVHDVAQLRARMQNHLQEHFEDVRCALIPLPALSTEPKS